jgi:uncharacterized protein
MSTEAAKSCLLPIRVVPNASKDVLVGWMEDGRLKIKVRAVPEGGRANRAVEEFLAKLLDLPKRAVAIEKGQSSHEKMVRIEGMTFEEARGRIGCK